MKHLLLISAFLVNSALAQSHYDWDSPTKKFDLGNSKSTMTLSVISTDNVQKVCEVESKNRGNAGFGYQVNSCAFWNADMTVCTIVTPAKSTMHLLGHELLHCLKGNWH